MEKFPPSLIQEVWNANALAKSRESLSGFLAHYVIDSRPEPRAWGLIIEPWQRDILAPLVPAIEQMAGIRKDYTGPKCFFYVMPKGHDKTGLIGRIATWAVGFGRHSISSVACAADEGQANLLLQSCKSEIRLNSWIQDFVGPYRKDLVGKETGGRLEIIASDAASASGVKCDLYICDEITFWKKREMYDMLIGGIEKRPDAVFLIISNAGIRDSWQWELLMQARSSPMWHVHETPERVQPAKWMNAERIAEVRKSISPGHAKRVFDNIWITGTECPLIPVDLYATCEAKCLWANGVQPINVPRRPEIYIGVDVGRTKDLTCIWEWELDKHGIAWTRRVTVLDKTPFKEQKRIIREKLRKDVVKAGIDQGGIGMMLAEELLEEFPNQVEPISFSSARRAQIALNMQRRFKEQSCRVPDDSTIRSDFGQVEEVDIGGAIPQLHVDKTGIGHADRFWAAALGLYVMPETAASTGLVKVAKSRAA